MFYWFHAVPSISDSLARGQQAGAVGLETHHQAATKPEETKRKRCVMAIGVASVRRRQMGPDFVNTMKTRKQAKGRAAEVHASCRKPWPFVLHGRRTFVPC
jgi:hypothetical protein